MPGNWMDWAKLIGTFTGAAILAAFAGWQIYARIVRPLVKRFEPIVNQIMGPGDEPGLREMVSIVGTQARVAAVAANNAAEGVNMLRRDVQVIHLDHVEMKKDVDGLKDGARRQGERLGAVESGIAAVAARVGRVEAVQDSRGCALNVPHSAEEVTTEGEAGSSGATGLGESPLPPRRGI